MFDKNILNNVFNLINYIYTTMKLGARQSSKIPKVPGCFELRFMWKMVIF